MNDLREITGCPHSQVRRQHVLPTGQPPSVYDLHAGYGQPKEIGRGNASCRKQVAIRQLAPLSPQTSPASHPVCRAEDHRRARPARNRRGAARLGTLLTTMLASWGAPSSGRSVRVIHPAMPHLPSPSCCSCLWPQCQWPPAAAIRSAGRTSAGIPRSEADVGKAHQIRLKASLPRWYPFPGRTFVNPHGSPAAIWDQVRG